MIGESRSLPSWLKLAKVALARVKVIDNKTDIDLSEVLQLHEEIRCENVSGWISRYIGEILLNINDNHTSEAEDWIKKAIEADKRNGMMFHLGKDYALYGEFFKRKGDTTKAKKNLNQAIEIYRECGADGWVVKAEKELKAISRKK